MAITVNTKRDWETDSIHYIDRTAAAALVEGAALSQAAGAATARSLTVGDTFLGFAARAALNAGLARIINDGTIRGLAVTGATTTTAAGTTVYATDNGTFTLTASGALAIGKVVRGTGTDEADVFIEGADRRSI